jgi:hypothetical protein
MHHHRYRSMLMAGASRLLLTADDGAEDGGAGGGGAAPAAAAPAPAAEAPAPAEEGAPAPEEGGGAAPAAEAPAPEEERKPTRVPWQQKRIDELTASAKTAREEAERVRREAEAANARAARYQALYGDLDDSAAPASPPPPPAAGGQRTYTETELREEANRLAQVNVINQRCDQMFAKGATAHAATWEKRINGVGQAFGPDLARRVDFFDAVSGLDNGADVYHELAGDLDHMAEVLAMPPMQMGMELARLSAKVAQKPKGPAISKLPAPIEPVEGAAAETEDLASMDMGSYAKTREAQRLARAKERGLI